MSALAPAPLAATRFALWGGEATVAVSDGDRLAAAAEVVREVTEEFDRACSPFRADSELSAVNRGAGTQVAIGPLLTDALAEALDAAELTGGAVDPTVGATTLALGLSGPRVSDGTPAVSVARIPGWRTVELDRAGGRVRIPAGARLDLGATAKALAADHAAAWASAIADCGVLVSLLGDLMIAGPAPEAGWPVHVTDDHRRGAGAPGQTIVLRDGGLATSSRAARHADGHPELHHLIDPATGEPAGGEWRTVSVHAASCLEANIVSTALMVGSPAAARLLAETELPARLVATDGTISHRHDWPADGERGR